MQHLQETFFNNETLQRTHGQKSMFDNDLGSQTSGEMQSVRF